MTPRTSPRHQRLWATVGRPRIADVDRSRSAASARELAASGLQLVLGTHLPAALDRADELLAVLADAPDLPRFLGPDQAAPEAMLGGVRPGERVT